MSIKISELNNITQYSKLLDNNALLETSSMLPPLGGGPETMTTSSISKIGLTNRFSFTSAAVPTISEQLIVRIPISNLLETSDSQAILLQTFSNDGTFQFPAGIYTVYANCIELQPTPFSDYRVGSAITEFFLGVGSLKATTRTGGVVTSLDNFPRSLPDMVTYSTSGTDAVTPYVSNVIYENGELQFYFRFVWDDYTATPSDVLVTGYIDVCPLPVPTYSPS